MYKRQDNAQIDQHVAADEKLHDMARIGLSLREERQSQRQTAADTVSYTHLDVYKRQARMHSDSFDRNIR